MLIAAAFREVLNSAVGIGLVVVFFASLLTLLVTAFGFGTRSDTSRPQTREED